MTARTQNERPFFALFHTPARASGERSLGRAGLAAALAIGLIALSAGCPAPWFAGRGERGGIVFATGELRSTEPTALDALDRACAHAVDRLGYEAVETDREADRIRWRARTAAGDPVEIALLARSPESTELRIRIGITGNEAKSRLVLEQIHQAL